MQSLVRQRSIIMPHQQQVASDIQNTMEAKRWNESKLSKQITKNEMNMSEYDVTIYVRVEAERSTNNVTENNKQNPSFIF